MQCYFSTRQGNKKLNNTRGFYIPTNMWYYHIYTYPTNMSFITPGFHWPLRHDLRIIASILYGSSVIQSSIDGRLNWLIFRLDASIFSPTCTWSAYARVDSSGNAFRLKCFSLGVFLFGVINLKCRADSSKMCLLLKVEKIHPWPSRSKIVLDFLIL